MRECDWIGAKVGWLQWCCVNFVSAEVSIPCSCWKANVHPQQRQTLNGVRDQFGALSCFCKDGMQARRRNSGSLADSFPGHSQSPEDELQEQTFCFMNCCLGLGGAVAMQPALQASILPETLALNNAGQSCWASDYTVHVCALVSQWGNSFFFFFFFK